MQMYSRRSTETTPIPHANPIQKFESKYVKQKLKASIGKHLSKIEDEDEMAHRSESSAPTMPFLDEAPSHQGPADMNSYAYTDITDPGTESVRGKVVSPPVVTVSLTSQKMKPVSNAESTIYKPAIPNQTAPKQELDTKSHGESEKYPDDFE
jgi:hypothetical protein